MFYRGWSTFKEESIFTEEINLMMLRLSIGPFQFWTVLDPTSKTLFIPPDEKEGQVAVLVLRAKPRVTEHAFGSPLMDRLSQNDKLFINKLMQNRYFGYKLEMRGLINIETGLVTLEGKAEKPIFSSIDLNLPLIFSPLETHFLTYESLKIQEVILRQGIKMHSLFNRVI